MSRVIVLSGGGSGIGRAVAERFARDGDQVVVIGRRPDALAETASVVAAAVPDAPAVDTVVADLAEPEQAERCGAEIRERHGRVDVLVNNAGGNVEIGAPAERTAGVTGAAWHWLGNFRMNVLTAVLLTEAVKDLLATPGRVILLSSIAALRGSGSGSYAAAKAALHPYAFDLAAELGPRDVTVNAVAPGYIGGTEFFRGRMSPEREKVLIGQTTTGRAGEPTDVADTVHWLASAGARHISGQIVQVNGGALLGR